MEEISNSNQRVMSVQDWALTIFISSLPLIGIIMLLVWAFSDDTNINKKNWAKGTLLIYVVMFALMMVFMLFFGGMAMFNQMFN